MALETLKTLLGMAAVLAFVIAEGNRPPAMVKLFSGGMLALLAGYGLQKALCAFLGAL